MSEREALVEALRDIRKLAYGDHWGTPKVCWGIIQRIDEALASADTHAKRGDVKQAPSARMGSAVPRADEADAQNTGPGPVTDTPPGPTP